MRLGLCGLGTVGGGLLRLLQGNREEIARRLPDGLELVHLGCRRDKPGCALPKGVKVSRDVLEVARDPQVDIVCELIGGTDTAKELALAALAAGKHLVTANKALIALHGEELFAAADKAGVQVRFEASVGGGIPIVKAIREGLAGDRIDCIAGVINGTCNYVLTQMAQAAGGYAEILAEAQRLGYAEADPSFDVEGIDAAHKLAILASIAFGVPLAFPAVYTEGISALTLEDMRFAEELGYRVRHLGIARRQAEGLELRVHPCLVPKRQMLAQVEGVMNAVLVVADSAGESLHYGAGAGAGPTAAAVMADLMDLVRAQGAQPLRGLGYSRLAELPLVPMAATRHSCYLKIAAEDKAGVMAQVGSVLSAHGVSIEALIQKDARGADAKIVILTNEALESTMTACCAEIAALPEVHSPPTRVRVADF